jgi:hypothetical protein
MVAVVAGGSAAELAELSEVALPGSGVAVIAAGQVPGTRWRLRLGESETSLDHLGLTMDPVPTADAQALGELLAARADVDGVAEVVDLHATPDADTTIEAAPAGGQGILVTADDEGAGALDAAGVVPRVSVLCSRPTVMGWAVMPTVKDGPAEEVVVRLAIADGPVSADRLYDQIWKARSIRDDYRDMVRQGVSRARSCLGGFEYISRAKKGMYQGRISSDLGDFRRLVASADRAADPAQELARLGQALALVSGTPFTEVAPNRYDWLTIDAGALPAIQRLVGDAAHHTVQLALRLGEIERAGWAADQGLLVAPVNEQLWRDRALVAEVAEDDEAIGAIHGRAVQTTGGLSLETEEWFAQLVGRRRIARQWRIGKLGGLTVQRSICR